MSTSQQRPIVVAVPHDDDIEAAVHYAAAEAQVHRCGVQLVHAYQPGHEGRADVVLARARSMTRLLAGPSVRITTRRVIGVPVESVLAAALEARAVVLRRRDSLHLMRVLATGSHGVGVRPPVICVPGDWSPWRRDPRPVLIAVEDPSNSAYAIEHGLQIAHEHGTALTILHAWHLSERDESLVGERIAPALSESLHASLHAEVDRVCQVLDLHDVPVDIAVRHGVAADVVMRAARDAQVLLLDRNAPAPDGSVHLGRTTRVALHDSPCPTVVLAARPLPVTSTVTSEPTHAGAVV